MKDSITEKTGKNKNSIEVKAIHEQVQTLKDCIYNLTLIMKIELKVL